MSEITENSQNNISDLEEAMNHLIINDERVFARREMYRREKFLIKKHSELHV